MVQLGFLFFNRAWMKLANNFGGKMSIKASAVCSRIDSIRRQKQLSQEQLAQTIQVSQPAISRYLRDRIPPAVVLLRLARLGQTSIEWILCGDAGQDSENYISEPRASYGGQEDCGTLLKHMPTDMRQALEKLMRVMAGYGQD